MSVHSVKVKRADEVVVGDWINWDGVAREVIGVTDGAFPVGGEWVDIIVDAPAPPRVYAYSPGSLVEVIDQ